MKILPEHFQELSKRINEVIQSNPEIGQDKFMSKMSYRWTLFHKMSDDDHYSFYHILTVYLTDNQIDTALKRITGVK